VKLLEDAKWPGMRHFDSHAYRTEDEAGVWDFARGSMRTYLIFKEKVARFNADARFKHCSASSRARRRRGRSKFTPMRARAQGQTLRSRAMRRRATRTSGSIS
jgi:xylose isomerase